MVSFGSVLFSARLRVNAFSCIGASKEGQRGGRYLMRIHVWFCADLALALGFLSGPVSVADEDKHLTHEVLQRWLEATKFAAPISVRTEIRAEVQDAFTYMVERKGYGEQRVREGLDEALGPYLTFLTDGSAAKGPTLKGLMLEAMAPGGAMARKAKRYPVVTVEFDVPPDRIFVNGEPVSAKDRSFNVPVGNVRISADREGGGSCASEMVSEAGNNYGVTCSFN